MAWEELEDESLDIVVGAYAPKPPGFHFASPPPATMATRVAQRVRNNTLGELMHVSEEIEAELTTEMRNEVQMLQNQLEAAPLITAAVLGVLCLCCAGCVRRYITSPSARERRRAHDVAVARPRRRLGKGFDDAEQSLELTGAVEEGLESPYAGSDDGGDSYERGAGRGGAPNGGGGGGGGGDGKWSVELTLVRGWEGLVVAVPVVAAADLLELKMAIAEAALIRLGAKVTLRADCYTT